MANNSMEAPVILSSNPNGNWIVSGFGGVSFDTTGGAGDGPCLRMYGVHAGGFSTFSRALLVVQNNADNKLIFGFHHSSTTPGLPTIGQRLMLAEMGDALSWTYRIYFDAFLALSLYQNNGGGGEVLVVASDNGAYVPDCFNKIECKIIIADGVDGFAQLRANGNIVATLATGNLKLRGTDTCGYIQFFVGDEAGATGDIAYRISNIYINDGTTADNNDYEGPCYVTTGLPTGTDILIDFTPSTGVDADAWQLVDNVPVDPTKYVSTNLVNAVATFTFPALPAGIEDVSCGKLIVDVDKSGAGARALDLIMRAAGVNYTIMDTIYLADGTQRIEVRFSRLPSTGVALTPSNIVSGGWGIKVAV